MRCGVENCLKETKKTKSGDRDIVRQQKGLFYG